MGAWRSCAGGSTDEAEETRVAPQGETDLLAARPETCSAYTGRRLQEDQTLKLAALVGIKADEARDEGAPPPDAGGDCGVQRLVETEMSADEQSYYETRRDPDAAKVWAAT